MVENLKLLIGIIIGLMEALPQVTPTGTIPAAEYSTLITSAITGVISGAGFQVTGFTDAQVQGATAALILAVRSWQAAPRA